MKQGLLARVLCVGALLASFNATGCAMLMQQVEPTSEFRLMTLGGASLGLSLVSGLLFETPTQRLEPLLAPYMTRIDSDLAPVPTP